MLMFVLLSISWLFCWREWDGNTFSISSLFLGRSTGSNGEWSGIVLELLGSATPNSLVDGDCITVKLIGVAPTVGWGYCDCDRCDNCDCRCEYECEWICCCNCSCCVEEVDSTEGGELEVKVATDMDRLIKRLKLGTVSIKTEKEYLLRIDIRSFVIWNEVYSYDFYGQLHECTRRTQWRNRNIISLLIRKRFVNKFIQCLTSTQNSFFSKGWGCLIDNPFGIDYYFQHHNSSGQSANHWMNVKDKETCVCFLRWFVPYVW